MVVSIRIILALAKKDFRAKTNYMGPLIYCVVMLGMIGFSAAGNVNHLYMSDAFSWFVAPLVVGSFMTVMSGDGVIRSEKSGKMLEVYLSTGNSATPYIIGKAIKPACWGIATFFAGLAITVIGLALVHPETNLQLLNVLYVLAGLGVCFSTALLMVGLSLAYSNGTFIAFASLCVILLPALITTMFCEYWGFGLGSLCSAFLLFLSLLLLFVSIAISKRRLMPGSRYRLT